MNEHIILSCSSEFNKPQKNKIYFDFKKNQLSILSIRKLDFPFSGSKKIVIDYPKDKSMQKKDNEK